MKATLSFELPAEDEDFDAALRGHLWRDAMRELDEWLRTRIKHGELDAGEHHALSDARDMLRDCMRERGLSWE